MSTTTVMNGDVDVRVAVLALALDRHGRIVDPRGLQVAPTTVSVEFDVRGYKLTATLRDVDFDGIVYGVAVTMNGRTTKIAINLEHLSRGDNLELSYTKTITGLIP